MISWINHQTVGTAWSEGIGTDMGTSTTNNYLSHNAIEYTISCILDVAGLPEDRYAVKGGSAFVEGMAIVFSVSQYEDQRRLFEGSAPFTLVDSFDGKAKVPLFGADAFSKWEDSKLTILADVVTISFALLSRCEEVVNKNRDRYNRFLYKDSLSAKYGFIGIPLVDEYAMLLKRELEAHGFGNLFKERKPNIVPTTDVDEIWRFRSLGCSLKSIVGGDLFIRKSPKTAILSCKELALARCKPERDPYYKACLQLMQVSLENGLSHIFYFLGYGDYNKRHYNVSHPSVHNLMMEMQKAGCVVGFHGGFGTCDSFSEFSKQKARVDAALGKGTTMLRHHYLCFDASASPRIWDGNGIKEDQTLSFPDHEGFRCGTCHPYHLYDFAADSPLAVVERPLILMDQTVLSYRRLTIEAALDSARMLRGRVFAVGGDFVILWHNGCLGRGMEKWYRDFYIRFIKESAEVLHNQEKVD